MEFSEKLKILRSEANLTQNVLADKLHISRQAISNYEQGRGYPSMDILVAMCKFFNTSLDDLLQSGVRKEYMKQIIIITSLFFASVVISFISILILTLQNSSVLIYIAFGIIIHIIPFMCLLVYLIFQYNPPKKANRFYGYRTKLSMSNQLMWDYAQNYFSLIFVKLSMILVGINLIYSIVSIFLGPNICLIVFCTLMCIHALSLLVPIFFVEHKLKNFAK